MSKLRSSGLGALGVVALLAMSAGPTLAQSNGGTGSGDMSPSSSSPAGGGLNRPQSPGSTTGVGSTPMIGTGATGNGGVLGSGSGTGKSVQGPADQGSSNNLGRDPSLNGQ